jgi:4,5-dihydroxyphthalate decarboxylase
VARANAAAKLTISLALTDNERTRPVIDGQVGWEAIEPVVSVLDPGEIFWRQLKFAEFDVSEMSLSSLFIRASLGHREWVALPIFTARRFFHTEMMVHVDAGIATPADLRGKRLGVPEFQQTAAVWDRGILKHEFGVDMRDIHYFMERGGQKSHGATTNFEPPPGVKLTYIPESSSIARMLIDHEIDGTLHYISSLNAVDRSGVDLHARPELRRLFPDPIAEGRRYYEKTGIFPINHCVVVRRELLATHPWLALNIYNTFGAAKRIGLARHVAEAEPYVRLGLIEPAARAALGRDVYAYGVVAARPVLETIRAYLEEQQLATNVPPIDEIFAPQTLAL